MDYRTYAPIMQDLLTAFNRCAPTGQTQRAMTDAIHAMYTAGESHKAMLARVTAELHKGLTTGDWIE
jgi:hypothetical protein